MIRRCLEQAQKEGELIEAYVKIDYPEKFVVGYIAALNREHIVLSLVSTDGRQAGLLLRPVQDVYHVSRGTQYLEKIKRLSADEPMEPFRKALDSEHPVRSILRLAQENRYIISVKLAGGERGKMVGVVTGLTEKNGEMLQVDEYGQTGEAVMFPLCNISEIVCNDEEQRVIRRLYQEAEQPAGAMGL